MGYKPLVDADELSFGTAWHYAMEVWYDPDNPRDQDRTLLEFTKLIRQQDIKAQEYGYDFDLQETEALGTGMLTYFFEWSAFNDDFVAAKLEQEFEVPILDPLGYPARCTSLRPCGQDSPYPHNWVFQGRADAIFQREDGSYWIGEHKTAKNETDWQWHVMEPQTLRYMWALRHSLGIDIHGVIRTEALKRYPQPPAKLKREGYSVDKRQATTTKLFLQTLQADNIPLEGKYLDYLYFLQSPEAPTFIRREYVDFNVDQMEEAGDNLYRIACDMIDSPRIYPNPTFMCKRCAFFVPCLVRQERGDYKYALETGYRNA